MREILFRGKHKTTGKWCEGNLHIDKQGVAIITPDDTPLGCYGQVDPDTVGQYTGMTDFDGKPIFEGDLFEPYDSEVHKSVVEFREGAFRVVSYGTLGAMMEYGWDETAGGYGELDEHDLLDWTDTAVIGNIHDNPELLKGGES